MNPTRVAVIGVGTMGRKHVDLLRAEPRCELVAVADPVPEAKEYARRLGVPYYADYREMLDRAKPEGAIIASPTPLHAPMGIACAEWRVHMLMEKPIAESVEAARRLSAAAERAGVALLVGHHRRHNPIIQKAREIVQGGKLGRLTAVTALWVVRKPDAYYQLAWRREPGGGPVLTNLIHDLDDLRYICGEIESVQAYCSNGVRGFAVEDTAVVSLRFAGGALGTVTVSDAAAAPWSWELTSGENAIYPQQRENCYLFAGTEASLAVPKLELWRYPGEQGWNAPLQCERIAVEPADPLVRQLRHFSSVIRGEEKPRITGADATRTLSAVLAVKRAAELGTIVTVD